MPHTVPIGSIRQAIDRHAFQLHKRLLTLPLQPLMERLDSTICTDTWLQAVAHHIPSQVWKHDNGLSDFQVWTAYRIATKRLNFYHTGCPTDNRCRALQERHVVPETSLHLFWECPKVRACWGEFLRHWTGAIATFRVFSRCFGNCVNRQAPEIPALQQSRLLESFQDDAAAGEQVWRRIWFLMSSICITYLWCERNDTVFVETPFFFVARSPQRLPVRYNSGLGV